ncbi:MAG: lipoyl(octanoyl) transferase LipB [Pseudomonadota bacterium]|nr:lipoyl(octanoyl) transferase LipB [Pseudomonadota bacterium]
MTQAPIRIIHVGQDVPYEDVVKLQEDAVQNVINGGEEVIFFVEHAPVYTGGTSFEEGAVGSIGDIPLVHTGRGGNVTYHGPGQRVIYPILDLTKRGRDIRAYICMLQKWMKSMLDEYNIPTDICDEIGVWVPMPSTAPKEQRSILGKSPQVGKIAAIGVRVRKWVTFHGIALNVDPNMEHFTRITPCGITDKGVCAIKHFAPDVTMDEVDEKLKRHMMTHLGA